MKIHILSYLFLIVSSLTAYSKDLYVIPVNELGNYLWDNDNYEGSGYYFVNLSDLRYWGHSGDDNVISITPSNNYPQNEYDPKFLSLEKSHEILKQLGLSPEDSLFIYNYKNGEVSTQPIKALLPLFAYINSPLGPDKDNVDKEYAFGFQLPKGTGLTGDFAYIGKENPFAPGGLEKIIWQATGDDHFPDQYIQSQLSPESINKNESYSYLGRDLDFYLSVVNYQIKENDKIKQRTAYIMQAKNKKAELVFERVYSSWEGYEPNFLPRDHSGSGQWTGQLFKEQGPIFYNAASHFTFGCNRLQHLNTNNPAQFIDILCDNRL